MNPVDEIKRYKCNTCNKEYENYDDASRCAAKGFNPKYKVGDILCITLKEDSKNSIWVHSARTRYYIVGKIEGAYHNLHIPMYSIFTKAFDNGINGYHLYEDADYCDVVSTNPSFQLEKDGAEFIGREAKNGRL